MTIDELKALPLDKQAEVWNSMTVEQQQATLASRSAPAAAPSAEEPGLLSRIWNYEVLSRDQADAFSTGLGQGLTFGYSEEMGGLAKDAGNWLGLTDDTGEAYKARQRAEQDRLSNAAPGSYLTGEISGALAPTLIPGVGLVSGPARGVQLANPVARVTANTGRAATFGGVDAALQASGRAEGGVGPRVVEGLRAIPSGAAFGGVGGAAGAVFSPFLKPAMEAISAKFGRTTSAAVERNVREIAKSSGMTVDDVVSRIAAGETLAGMNDTTRMAARAIRNADPAAGQKMIEATGGRLETATGEAVTAARTALVGPRLAVEPNLRATATDGLNAARTGAGDTLAAARAAAGDVSSMPTLDIMLDAVGRTPRLADELNTTLRISGSTTPLFKKTPDGMVPLRVPTIAEAEIITRELQNRATAAYSGSGGLMSTTRGEAFQRMGDDLRSAIDTEAPQLGPLRAAYSAAKEAEDVGFPLGFKARSMSPDELALGFGPLTDAGKEAARLGAAARIGEDVGKTRRNTSLINEMMDPGRFLGRNIDEMATRPMDRAPAARAQSEGRLLDALQGNSSTVAQAEAAARLRGGAPVSGSGVPWAMNTLGMLADAVRVVVGNDRGLDQAGLQRLADMLMQSGPGGAAVIDKILKRRPLTSGETASLARMWASASGAAAASPTNAPGAVTGSGGILDMMFGRDAYGRPLPQPEP
jgi:hypothetical protein